MNDKSNEKSNEQRDQEERIRREHDKQFRDPKVDERNRGHEDKGPDHNQLR